MLPLHAGTKPHIPVFRDCCMSCLVAHPSTFQVCSCHLHCAKVQSRGSLQGCVVPQRAASGCNGAPWVYNRHLKEYTSVHLTGCASHCLTSACGCLAGKWEGQQVAIKVLSYQQSSARAFEAFSECLVSQRLHHPNVVRPLHISAWFGAFLKL